jgi:phosphatidylglycerol:prolipoprotein diacylglycerol transferase
MSLKPAWIPGWMWAQTYDGNILGTVIPPPGVYPTPLYEFIAGILLFAVLCAFRSNERRSGHLFSIYLLLAGFERLLIEKIRVNIDHEFFGLALTQAELISLGIVFAGLFGVLITLKTRTLLVKGLISLGVLSALSACVPW